MLMSTFKKFEEIVSWQKARKLNKALGKHIDEGKFNKSNKLISQIEGSAGSIMDNIAEGLNGEVTGSLYSFFISLKVHAENSDHNCTGLQTEAIWFKMNLMNYTVWQWKQLCFYKS